jgi:hypothetical protein
MCHKSHEASTETNRGVQEFSSAEGHALIRHIFYYWREKQHCIVNHKHQMILVHHSSELYPKVDTILLGLPP